MTEDRARQICFEMGATLSIRNRKGKPYVYVARWIAAEALPPGWKLGTRGKGQSVDRYVCPLTKLADLSPDQLRSRILALPQNPNKRSIPLLEGEAADLHNALSFEREPVSNVYRRLGWTRKRFETALNEHYDQLISAGARLHVATASHSRKEAYITIAGIRYSDICRVAPQELERTNPEVDQWLRETGL